MASAGPSNTRTNNKQQTMLYSGGVNDLVKGPSYNIKRTIIADQEEAIVDEYYLLVSLVHYKMVLS
jgi:hypothetical protein